MLEVPENFKYVSPLEIIIFVIKPNPIYANNNPKF